jgi:glucose-6-phosphate 1-dehydrogenase
VVVAGVLDGQSSGAGDVAPDHEETTVSITVVGASGDLAKKKIFPALFALFYEDWLPKVPYCVSFFQFS